eukprot:CAMPEP_0206375972 /NCGR_PEP_ID=MMETSP0294-20121207/9201_1 /ASSEMBLY_ACC=CAM_ASM_000327 /TAXON_ID=39354 /ORGANISM="Heterosigma akashiwo, Strain CCMP2393" /LENGTH=61 /DNA_ID=CAMNT_0053824001 /DNA_START=721 /DNA_END=906 /DNA_ORIENTATION=+
MVTSIPGLVAQAPGDDAWVALVPEVHSLQPIHVRLPPLSVVGKFVVWPHTVRLDVCLVHYK